MKLIVGFSPCPNDTFIFDALVNNKIDTEGLQFEVVLEDVETLNQWALQGKLDITKLSYGVLAHVLDKYIVLNSGSALGRGVGPLLISNLPAAQAGKEQGKLNVEEIPVAIPGEHTTANLLFSLAYPKAKKKIFLRYDEIENFVSANKGLGVIIHENRFTYEAKGLQKITDLGEFWGKKTGHPIPLGGIVVKREIDEVITMKVDRLIKRSIEFAFFNYPRINDYIRSHSQEMSEEVMRKHIDLYVNNYSLDLGAEGKKAIIQLLKISESVLKKNIAVPDQLFLPT